MPVNACMYVQYVRVYVCMALCYVCMLYVCDVLLQDLSFTYPGGNEVYRHVECSIDLDSRIALVGPNGAGKSTLLKLITGDLIPSEGVCGCRGADFTTLPKLERARMHEKVCRDL